MSEKEERILTNIFEALPHMSEFDKGYVLGLIDSKVSEKRELCNKFEKNHVYETKRE